MTDEVPFQHTIPDAPIIESHHRETIEHYEIVVIQKAIVALYLEFMTCVVDLKTNAVVWQQNDKISHVMTMIKPTHSDVIKDVIGKSVQKARDYINQQLLDNEVEEIVLGSKSDET